MAERLHSDRTVGFPDLNPDSGEPDHGQSHDTTLQKRARQAGRALGTAVVTLRDARGAISDIVGETREVAAVGISNLRSRASQTGARIGNLAEQASSGVAGKARAWQRVAASATGDLARRAAENVEDLRSQVQSGYYRARLRLKRTADEHPMRFVIVGGLLGLLLGIGLRTGRSKRE